MTPIDGERFIEMISAATKWLEKSVPEINALNVFPVPDGDSGTNMLMTMRAGLQEAIHCSPRDLSSIARAVSHGTFFGARGNSGVILSRAWRGFAQGFDDCKTMSAGVLAEALAQGAKSAYDGLSNPVEGTILTVMRESALAAQSSMNGNGAGTVTSVMEAAVDAARTAVANTPNQLAVLKEAGVVDAGGQGLCTLFEGILLYLEGNTEQLRSSSPEVIAYSTAEPVSDLSAHADEGAEEAYGYCTEFVLQGEGLDPNRIRKRLEENGKSLIVVGDGSAVRVHIHAIDPSPVIHYAVSLGTIQNVSIRSMDEQHRDFLAMQRPKNATPVAQAVVVVSSGEGLDDVFRKLGAIALIPGGQTMNPSARDILASVESAPSQNVIILPNNKNIIRAAQQAQSLTKKRTVVIPTESVPQGVAALLAFDLNNDFETNLELMTQAKSGVKTVEITHAVRSTRLRDLRITKNQLIGLLDGELLAAGDSPEIVIHQILEQVHAGRGSVVTVYHGNGTDDGQAEKLAGEIRHYDDSFEVEVVHGGQPSYEFIVSIE